MIFTIPLFMVVAFLLLTIGVAWRFKRHNRSFREYAVGDKQLPTGILAATVLATAYGGASVVRSVELIHNGGLCWILLGFLISCLPFWFISRLALRMAPLMHHLSMSETIGRAYGRHPRIISGLSHIILSIVAIAAQIQVIAIAITMCVGPVNSKTITILATFILIGYTIIGGIRVVTITDVVQLITFCVILPFVAWWLMLQTGTLAPEALAFVFTQEKFQFSSLCHFDMHLMAKVAVLLSGVLWFINPPVIQRVYMSTDHFQASRVFWNAGLGSLFMMFLIVLIGLFAFAAAPGLPANGIWGYILTILPPFLKGGVAIGLLAVAMSTADSYVNTCSIIISHDVVNSIIPSRAMPYSHQLRLTKLVALLIGILSMVLSIYCVDLMEITMLSFDCFIPIATAPFILAIFGFRSGQRTALIGMATGVITILAWNKWVAPTTGINGSFVCMLANGLAMMAAHYLIPQPLGTGWVKLDHPKPPTSPYHTAIFKRLFTKIITIAQLRPHAHNLLCLGLYNVTTTLLMFGIMGKQTSLSAWTMLQLLLSACLLWYGMTAPKVKRLAWLGWSWFISLVVCLPLNMLWQLWHSSHSLLAITLAFIHVAVTLWILPLYWGIRCMKMALLGAILICYLKEPMSWLSGNALLPLVGLGIPLWAITIYAKLKIMAYVDEIAYLRDQQKLAKQWNNHALGEDGDILQTVTKDVTQSVSFIDKDIPLNQEDFKSIINKFSEWAIFLKKQTKTRDHMLLRPTEIALENLIHKLEISLKMETGLTPRLLIEKIEKVNTIPAKIICDVQQVTHLLVTAVLRIANLEQVETQIIKIQLQTTHLEYRQGDASEPRYPLVCPAIAIVVHDAAIDPATRPQVQSCYKEAIEDQAAKQNGSQTDADPGKQRLQYIIQAHYGILEIPNPDSLLLVLPRDVTKIQDKMISRLPMECLTSEVPITAEEQGASITTLMDCHAFICGVGKVSSTVMADTFLLLRRSYGSKRHPSGQLFYLRAAGIAQLVAEWISDVSNPRLIYAALLYDAIRYTRLPLSYIRTHYDLGVLCFVENVLKVDKYEEMVKPLLRVSNRFKEAIDKKQPSVLYIKLAERLYDLRHAAGYTNMDELKYIAQETLIIDVQVARTHLGAEIATELETAAKQALDSCKGEKP